MYRPRHFKQEDTVALHDAIRRSGIGTLITFGEGGLEASHIPMLIEADTPSSLGTLHGHMARANGQWRSFSKDVPALAVFLGPDAYVTPSWYATKQQTGKVVPTWNYVAVHAYGELSFFDDPSSLKEVVTKLTRAKEASRPNPWEVSDAPEDFIDGILKGIVGFRLSITRLEGQWKLSQNRNEADVSGVLDGLKADGHLEVAAEMESLDDS